MVLKIPTNDEYNSLNLAAAVQIVCYEIFTQINSNNEEKSTEDSLLVSQEKMEQFYLHLEECLIQIGYHD